MKIKFISIILVTLILLSCNNGNNQSKSTNSSNVSTPENQSKLQLLCGTYTRNEGWVNGKASGFYALNLDTASGKLEIESTSTAIINPSYLTIHPNKKWVYVVSESNEFGANKTGTVNAYHYSSADKKFELVNTVSSMGNSPCFVSIDNTGKFVMIANYGSGSVAVYPIGSKGELLETVSSDQHVSKGLPPRQEGPHAHSMLTNPLTNVIYSADLGSDKVFTYKLDTISGKLLSSGNIQMKKGAGPRHIAFHPTLHYLYVINELDGTIVVIKTNEQGENATIIQSITTMPKGSKAEPACADIHITQSGDFLYGSNRGDVNNIVMYRIDKSNGQLTSIGSQQLRIKVPRSFIIDPSDSYMLVAGQNSSTIEVFKLNKTTGLLSTFGDVSEVPTPVCLKFY